MPEAEAYLLFERLRWQGRAPDCPHCGATERGYVLNTVDGSGRRTRTGVPTARRLWKCGACRRQFSVLTGTVLHGTRVPLPAWVAAVQVLFAGGSVSSSDLSRATGFGREAARHVLARWAAASECIPQHVARPDGRGSDSGGSDSGGSAEAALAALLAIPAPDAERVRDLTPSRRRPRRQHGPRLDLGRD